MEAQATLVDASFGPSPRSFAIRASEAAPRGEVLPFTSETLSFRAFRLLPAARILLRHGQPVEIGSRAFDLLHVLLRSRGSVVERADIFRQVWPTTIVDESNLRFQMSCLRKALGADRDLLKTIPGRGYMLAAEIASPPAAPVVGDRGARLTALAQAAGGASGDTPETCELLRGLLRSVLDELWAMTRPEIASPATDSARLSS